MRSTLRHAFHLIGRDQRLRWVILATLALLASGFEVLGAALVYVLLGLVANPSGDIDLPLIGDVRTIAPDGSEDELLLWMMAAMGCFFLTRGLVQVGVKYLQQRVAHNAGARLSNRLVEGYLRWPYAVHLNRTSSELIRNAHMAVKQLVGQVFIPVIRISAELILILAMLLLLVAIAPGATLMAVLVVGGAALLLLLVVQPRLKLLGKRSHQLARDTLATLQQSLHGVRDIKVLGREQHFVREYGSRRLEYARTQYLASTLKELPPVIIELALLGFILVFFALTIVSGDDAQGALSVLGLFTYAGLRLQPSLHKIVAGFNELKYAAAPLEDLDADLRAVEELPPYDDDVEPFPLAREIALEDVGFRYEGASRNAVTSASLKIARGEQIGICGPTGGGKTTLIDIIAGLLTPTLGRVTVDGEDLQPILRSWQRNIGLVSQMVFLTDDSLRKNIALGVPAHRINDDAVQRALKLAQLDDFVHSLPDGLETTVGERGVRVSGGQRQRIAIARALYRAPQVLIFDEGTSALDNTTEAALMDAIARLRGDHTILLVAHRLSTVRNCDRVVFVEDGLIRAVGPYRSLVEQNSSFRQLAGL